MVPKAYCFTWTKGIFADWFVTNACHYGDTIAGTIRTWSRAGIYRSICCRILAFRFHQMGTMEKYTKQRGQLANKPKLQTKLIHIETNTYLPHLTQIETVPCKFRTQTFHTQCKLIISLLKWEKMLNDAANKHQSKLFQPVNDIKSFGMLDFRSPNWNVI